MFIKLLLAFTLIPLVEIYVLLTAGAYLGVGPTILLILLSGFLGAALLRAQGFRILVEINQKAAAGQVPGNELIQGALLLVGGVTLLTPGFVTDCIGLSMLVPSTRRILARTLQNWIQRRISSGQWRIHIGGFPRQPQDWEQ